MPPAAKKKWGHVIYSVVSFLCTSKLFVGPEHYFRLNAFMHVIDQLLDKKFAARPSLHHV